MTLAPHQQELLDWWPDLDPRDIPTDWRGNADLDEQVHRNKQKRLTAAEQDVKLTRAAQAPRPFNVKQFRGDLADLLADLIGPLMKRIAELEAEQMKFCGVWKHGDAYRKGSLVTHHGSAWFAHADTVAMPGTSNDWQLAIKKGRDGKDGKPARKTHALA